MISEIIIGFSIIIWLLAMFILPPFIVALIVYLNLRKKINRKKKWIISLVTFIISGIIWYLFVKFLAEMFVSGP